MPSDSLSKLSPKFLLSAYSQVERKCSFLPGSFFSKIYFPPTAERGEGKYDLLYQNSIRKYEDDYKRYIIYSLYELLLTCYLMRYLHFFKCDGFAVNNFSIS